MEVKLSFGSYNVRFGVEKRDKKVITYLPEGDVLNVLKKTDKADFAASPQAIEKAKSYQLSLKNSDFWKEDPGYAFIENYLPKQPFSLLDIGCHIGQLAFYLKQTGKWSTIKYTGTDVLKTFVDLAKEEHTGGSFFESDIQKFTTNEYFDVVFTKGTIISTFNPVKSTENVLSIPSKKTFLIHTPISDHKLAEDFYNILVNGKNQVYSSSVLSREVLEKLISKSGYTIKAERKRAQKFNVINKGSYHLFDFVLEKN